MRFGRIRSQRGAGSIGCLFMIAVIAAAIYAGAQFGIPRLRHSSFEDRITESLVSLRQLRTAEEVQRQIIQIAADFDIELTPAQVKVDTSGNRLRMDVAYDKLIDLKVWQKTVSFRMHRDPAP